MDRNKLPWSYAAERPPLYHVVDNRGGEHYECDVSNTALLHTPEGYRLGRYLVERGEVWGWMDEGNEMPVEGVDRWLELPTD